MIVFAGHTGLNNENSADSTSLTEVRSQGERASATDIWGRAQGRLRRLLAPAFESTVLLVVFAVLMLGVIWGATLHLIKLEQSNAERSAALLSQELAETYEAHAVRALREIDQTLKFVKYAYELKGTAVALREMKARDLLPPDLLFTVSIVDRIGDVVISTHPAELKNVVDQDYFMALRAHDIFTVGQPHKDRISGEWKLQFSRRLNSADGDFAGMVMVAVDASYFVSGYEAAKLGERGVLGLLGSDGTFRVRRTGDKVFVGGEPDHAIFRQTAPLQGAEQQDSETHASVNSWDDVRRFISTRQLYDYPLSVIVGLSIDEQLEKTDDSTRRYLWWASSGSLLLTLFLALLSRMSWKLAQSRQRILDAQAAHAKDVEHLAYHDALTGLPNRPLFCQLLNHGVGQAQRYNHRLALLFIDLDHFKHINDARGHDAGDQLLQEVAKRLKSCLRSSDTVARLGGDEFVVLLQELGQGEYEAAVARKILAAIAHPVFLCGEEFSISASIGISLYPQDGANEMALAKNADSAMYRAKNLGKNNYQYYSSPDASS